MDRDERPLVEEDKEPPPEGIIELIDAISDIEDDFDINRDTDIRILTEAGKVYDLVDVIEEEVSQASMPEKHADSQNVYDLVDVVEDVSRDGSVALRLNDESMKKISGMVENSIREIVPGIAERIIREEIEKLKSGE